MAYISYQMSDFEMWAVTLSAPCYLRKPASMELVTGLGRFSFNKRRICQELTAAYGSGIVRARPKRKYDVELYFYQRILGDSCVSQYNEMRMHLLSAPEGPDAYICSISDPRLKSKTALAAKTLFLLPHTGIRAFPIARAIYFIRCCVLLGSEHPYSAMTKIMEIARYAQTLYSSWEEFFTAYAIGEQFVSETPDAALTDDRLNELRQLMTSPQSAARYFPWHMRL